MGTYSRSQAHRSDRIDPMHVLGWILFIVGAIVLVAAGWFVLQAFLGMGTYIETVIP